MSAFGEVTYSENANTAVESITEDIQMTSTVEKQVEKFDTSYSTDKLKELYAEYDKITIDEDKIRSLTQIKTNAVDTKLSLRTTLVVTTTVLVTILLAFLAIYNIFVINGMTSSITYLQEEVITCESNLYDAKLEYDSLTNVTWEELEALGFVDMASSGNIEAISVPEKVEVIELQAETNWFDAVCNFVCRIFG